MRRQAVREEILAAAWGLAREVGLADLTLRDLARRVGMQPPSLYTHFASKHAIYDAMYGQAWAALEAHAREQERSLSEHPRTAATQVARIFFDFATADLARHQLMNQRTIPGFEPTPETYAVAVRVLEHAVRTLTRLGATERDDIDIYTALLSGLADQQLANDPGGDRFGRLLERAVDMWADAAGIPAHTTTPTPERGPIP